MTGSLLWQSLHLPSYKKPVSFSIHQNPPPMLQSLPKSHCMGSKVNGVHDWLAWPRQEIELYQRGSHPTLNSILETTKLADLTGVYITS